MAEDAKLTRTELIGWFVTIALTVICLLLPEQGILTAQIKIFLAITVCALSLAAFELVPTLMIGGLLPAAYVFFKCADVKVVMSPWLGTTALMLVGAFFMAVTLEDCGLLQRIAYNLMCFSKGNYFVLLMTIFSVSVIMNIITIGRAYLIMAPLCFGLCVSLNGLKGKTFAFSIKRTKFQRTYDILFPLLQRPGFLYRISLQCTTLRTTTHHWFL